MPELLQNKTGPHFFVETRFCSFRPLNSYLNDIAECHRAHNLFNKFNLFRQEMLHIKLHEHKRADQHRIDRKQADRRAEFFSFLTGFHNKFHTRFRHRSPFFHLRNSKLLSGNLRIPHPHRKEHKHTQKPHHIFPVPCQQIRCPDNIHHNDYTDRNDPSQQEEDNFVGPDRGTCLLVCESEKPHAEHRVGVEHASLHDVGEVCDQVLGAGQEICRSVQEAADAQSGEQASVGCLVGNGQLVALAEFEGILKPDIVVA